MVIISVTGLLGTVMEALVVPYGVHIDLREGLIGLLAAAVPIGTLTGVAVVAMGDHDHRALLRTAALVTVVSASAASALFFAEVDGLLAFVAFLVGGGIFAVSIPTNTVIGLRLDRSTRATAMGIAVGTLMGSQALGAALGGLLATQVGTPATIGWALALAAAFGLWCFLTTPVEARHLRRPKARTVAEAVLAPPELESEPTSVG
jgi:MFS family permease